ncbi:MAG: Mannosyl-glycoprotein endo-beta-N-acetylglucosaminidase [Bacteroidota bacterium]|jgi:uncharacterized FlgJ-related protein
MNNDLQPAAFPREIPGPRTLSSKRSKYLLFGGFLLMFCFLFTVNDYSSVDLESGLYHDMLRTNHGKNYLTLNQHNVRKEIEKCGLLCPDLVFAQIMLESGNLNSLLAKKANNLIGMRYPYRRTTKAIGIFLPGKEMIVLGDRRSLLKYSGENNYAVYSNWQDCLSDYKHWQDECFKLQDRYLNFLGEYYAEDDAYIQKIKSISRQ